MKKSLNRLAFAALAATVVLAGCDQEEYLPGARDTLRDYPGADTVSVATAFAAPPPVTVADWTHRAANPAHRMPHLALSASPSRLWSTKIGSGEGRKYRITADPVVAGGRIFTLDSRATVQATSTGGKALWSVDLTPASDREGDASGGGLATDGARVYVTTAFGLLVALDAGTGAEIWSQRLGAAATSAPTVVGDTVYAVSTDSRGWAIDAGTGRIRWEITGTPSPSGVLGGGSPTVTERLALFPFHSGDLTGALKGSGIGVWTAPLTGSRRGRVYTRFSDVTGDPVVVGDTVYASNHSGRSFAIDAASGERLWTATDGAMNPPLVLGGSMFLVSDQNQLVRLNAATGERIWAVDLPYYENRRLKRRRAITDHYGPLLASGRLLVASGDGEMRFFDPASGGLLGEVAIPGGAASMPVIAGGVLYVVSGNGQLHAFR